MTPTETKNLTRLLDRARLALGMAFAVYSALLFMAD